MQLGLLRQTTTACRVTWIRQTSASLCLKTFLENKKMLVWSRAETLKKVTQGCMLNPDRHSFWNQFHLTCVSFPCSCLCWIHTWRNKTTKGYKCEKHESLLLFGKSMGIMWNPWSGNKEWMPAERIQRADRWREGIRCISCNNFNSMYLSQWEYLDLGEYAPLNLKFPFKASLCQQNLRKIFGKCLVIASKSCFLHKLQGPHQ